MLKVAAECHLHGLVHRDMKPEVIVGQEMEDVLFLVVDSLVDHASHAAAYFSTTHEIICIFPL